MHLKLFHYADNQKFDFTRLKVILMEIFANQLEILVFSTLYGISIFSWVSRYFWFFDNDIIWQKLND